jgi:hypothetical protein
METPLQMPRLKWENNIKIYIKEIGCEVMELIDLGRNMIQQYFLATTVMKFRLP